MYADIMLPLVGMGVPFSIDPGVGPIIHEPVRSRADVARLRVVESAEEATPELFAAIRQVGQALGGSAAVIGFAGAPFTVASYLIEGRPSRDHPRTKALMHGDPGCGTGSWRPWPRSPSATCGLRWRPGRTRCSSSTPGWGR